MNFLKEGEPTITVELGLNELAILSAKLHESSIYWQGALIGAQGKKAKKSGKEIIERLTNRANYLRQVLDKRIVELGGVEVTLPKI